MMEEEGRAFILAIFSGLAESAMKRQVSGSFEEFIF
tara:strand:- start:24 stop:131 length:108 start_codon:yes stop_codon:yes gene_type:complete